MNSHRWFLLALCLSAAALSPATAQLIHVSVDNPDGHLLFKTDDASIPWNTSAGFITHLEFTFDSQAKAGQLDPGRNYWRMTIENPEMGRNFTIMQPWDTATTWDQGVVFERTISTGKQFLDAELDLVFDSTIPNDGSLPKFPLPALGSTEFSHSQFSFDGANAPAFNVPHLAEAYGGLEIQSISVTMTAIPEPSVYGVVAFALVGAAIVVRRRRLGTRCAS